MAFLSFKHKFDIKLSIKEASNEVCTKNWSMEGVGVSFLA